jgi:membrane protein implicated in regulation of membrane protease activity
MVWWYWIVLAVALVVIELVTPGGLFALFFGVAALLLGLLELLGVVERDLVQWILFPVLALLSLAVFRAPLLEMIGRNDATDVDALVGEVAFAADAIPPGAYGRAELRGSTWTARNLDSAPLVARQRCRVVAVRGLELDIRSD